MCPSGIVTPTTTPDFRSAFDILDIDHDGKISRDDLKTFYSCFSGSNEVTNDEDIGSMIFIADSNKDGFVEFDEFKQVLDCSKTSPVVSGGVMEDVFKVMDRDGDGKVSFDDLKSYMNWAGFSTGDEDIKTMIKLGGGDDKSGIPRNTKWLQRRNVKAMVDASLCPNVPTCNSLLTAFLRAHRFPDAYEVLKTADKSVMTAAHPAYAKSALRAVAPGALLRLAVGTPKPAGFTK
ncbi:hypothetical protein IFM89_010630 [Coptis chinensis]|uniref:EF-hand domain-containing protein n=1 Tax=Coptis chinensis TaxID=261450 RepID=A0A835IMK4_9MAGN|nr:hypothetical protein IFM89_010630 [Coptis chinensis]